MSSSPTIFDRALYRNLRTRIQPGLRKHDFLINLAVDNIIDRIDIIKKQFPRPLITDISRLRKDQISRIGQGAGAQMIYAMTLNEKTRQTTPDVSELAGDEELLPFGRNSLDAVISILSLQTVNDLPGALIQVNYALKPDGLFLGVMFGGETLYELRTTITEAESALHGRVSPRIHPFADKQQMGALMQRAGFALPVVDSDIVRVTYTSLSDLMQDVKGMGENNILLQRSRFCPGKTFFEETENLYRKYFSDGFGRLEACFELIYLIGWAPSNSQQKPLRPGESSHRLAEFLQTREVAIKGSRQK